MRPERYRPGNYLSRNPFPIRMKCARFRAPRDKKPQASPHGFDQPVHDDKERETISNLRGFERPPRNRRHRASRNVAAETCIRRSARRRRSTPSYHDRVPLDAREDLADAFHDERDPVGRSDVDQENVVLSRLDEPAQPRLQSRPAAARQAALKDREPKPFMVLKTRRQRRASATSILAITPKRSEESVIERLTTFSGSSSRASGAGRGALAGSPRAWTRLPSTVSPVSAEPT